VRSKVLVDSTSHRMIRARLTMPWKYACGYFARRIGNISLPWGRQSSSRSARKAICRAPEQIDHHQPEWRQEWDRLPSILSNGSRRSTKLSPLPGVKKAVSQFLVSE